MYSPAKDCFAVRSLVKDCFAVGFAVGFAVRSLAKDRLLIPYVYTTLLSSNCGSKITRIYYTNILTEEWELNEDKWECIGYNSLMHDPQMEVHCSECDTMIGTGQELGF